MSSKAKELLKAASAKRSVARSIGSALRGAVVASGDIGAGVAEGLGASPGLGKAVGMGGAVLAGASAAGKGKRKVDEWRYRNGLYSQQY